MIVVGRKHVSSPIPSGRSPLRNALSSNWSPVRYGFTQSTQKKRRDSIQSASSNASSNYESQLREEVRLLNAKYSKLKNESAAYKHEQEILIAKLRSEHSRTTSELNLTKERVHTLLINGITEKYSAISTESLQASLHDTRVALSNLKIQFEESSLSVVTKDKEIEKLRKTLEKKRVNLDKIKEKMADTQRLSDINQFLMETFGMVVVKAAIGVKQRIMSAQGLSPESITEWKKSFEDKLNEPQEPNVIDEVRLAYRLFQDMLGKLEEDRDVSKILEVGSSESAFQELEALIREYDEIGYIPDEDQNIDENPKTSQPFFDTPIKTDLRQQIQALKQSLSLAGDESDSLKIKMGEIKAQNDLYKTELAARDALDRQRVNEMDKLVTSFWSLDNGAPDVSHILGAIESRVAALNEMGFLEAASVMEDFLKVSPETLDEMNRYFLQPESASQIPIEFLLLNLYVLRADTGFWGQPNKAYPAKGFLSQWLGIPLDNLDGVSDDTLLTPLALNGLLAVLHQPDASDTISVATVDELVKMMGQQPVEQQEMIVKDATRRVQGAELHRRDLELSSLLDQNLMPMRLIHFESTSRFSTPVRSGTKSIGLLPHDGNGIFSPGNTGMSFLQRRASEKGDQSLLMLLETSRELIDWPVNDDESLIHYPSSSDKSIELPSSEHPNAASTKISGPTFLQTLQATAGRGIPENKPNGSRRNSSVTSGQSRPEWGARPKKNQSNFPRTAQGNTRPRSTGNVPPDKK